MESKINVIKDSVHEIEVSLTYDEIENNITEAYLKERKTISMPGFRKGKVPIPMLKKLYGDAIEYKASEEIANKKFWDIVKEENLKPISTPQLTDLDFKRGEKLSFKVKYEVKPVLELKDYTNLEIEKPVFTVKDDNIEKEIDSLLKTKANYEESDEVVDENFRITVELHRLDEEGEPIENESNTEDLVMDLSTRDINPEIRQNALNKKVGDKFNFHFTDEHEHDGQLHKVEYNYEVLIKKIEKIILPEITEELCKQFSNNKAKTLDELKEFIRIDYKNYYDSQSESIFINSLLNKIVESNDFEPPEGFVETLHKRLLESEKENAKRQNVPYFDEKAVSEELKPKSVWNAKWQIILENIAEKENIEVNDSDLENLAKEESVKTGISVEKLVKFYTDTNRKEALLEDKVIDFLKKNNTVREVDSSAKKTEDSEENKDEE